MRYVRDWPSRVSCVLPPQAQQSRSSLNIRLMPTKSGKNTAASATPGAIVGGALAIELERVAVDVVGPRVRQRVPAEDDAAR
jgi:hypothetical protein